MLKNIKNFRDLGGLKTEDGKKVKKGLFFRSAMLNDATDEDIEFLKSLNLKHIFDYRDSDEVALMKNNPYEKIGAKYHNIPAYLNNRKLLQIKKASYVKKLFHKVTLGDVKDTYSHLPFENMGYRAMVERLKKGEVPIYQHCTAGKDRAGMGSALLLGILGVEYDEILADYLKSLEIKEYIENKIAGFIPKPVRKFLLRRYQPLFIVDKELLDAAIEAIKEKYNTFENYLLAEYNLLEEDIKAIRERYTE